MSPQTSFALPSCSEIMSEQAETSRERICFPQHLHSLIQSATTVTIVADNPKAPPLPEWSPLFRNERGLPPLFPPPSPVRGLMRSSTYPDGKPESRWDSMPQPKRFVVDESPITPSLARIRLDGQLRGAAAAAVGEEDGACLSPVRGGAGGGWEQDAPSSSSSSPLKCASPDKPPGLNIPRRRDSFETGKEKEGVTLLSQVLGALALSDDDEEGGDSDEEAGAGAGHWTMGPSTVVEEEDDDDNADMLIIQPPLGRFTKPLCAPALSPQPSNKKSADQLSIPVRRASIDSIDFVGEDLEGFSDDDEEEETLHAEFTETDSFDDEEYDEDDEFDCFEDDFDFRSGTCKDDMTLVSATTVTTSSTLSTLNSSNCRQTNSRR